MNCDHVGNIKWKIEIIDDILKIKFKKNHSGKHLICQKRHKSTISGRQTKKKLF